jgi:hypothetical protein
MEENTIDLKAEREQRIKEALAEREVDKLRAVYQEEVTDVLAEMNVRLSQYTKQYQTYSFGFLVLQTVSDFKRYVILLQGTFQQEKTIAFEKKTQKKISIVNGFFNYEE